MYFIAFELIFKCADMELVNIFSNSTLKLVEEFNL